MKRDIAVLGYVRLGNRPEPAPVTVPVDEKVDEKEENRIMREDG